MRAPTSSRAQAIAGVALLLAGVLAVVLVFKTFNGDFGDTADVSATVAQAGDSLEKGDSVTYRDVVVGEVTSYEPTGDGSARLTLRLQNEHADDVPDSVTAIAVPATVFGTSKIVLLPPRNSNAGGTLHDGSVVAADRSPSAAGLQTALSDLYTLLTAVRPSELNSALTALGQALQGRGDDIGRLLDQAASFLDTVTPALPDVQRAIRSFATATESLASSAPDLLAAVRNSLTPAAAIVRRQAALRDLLDVLPGTADRARGFLQRTGDDYVTVVTNARPVLAALAANPNALGDSVIGFRNVGTALNSVFRNGRANVNVLATGTDAASLVPVLLGQKTHVVDDVADPPGYTSADCPQYPGASGRNCGAAVIHANDHAGAVRAVRTLVGAMSGLPASRVPDAATLLLGPLLRGAPAVLR